MSHLIQKEIKVAYKDTYINLQLNEGNKGKVKPGKGGA